MSPIQVHFLPPNTLQSQNGTSELRSVKALVRSNAACFSHGQRLRRRQLEQEPKKSQEDVLADAITQYAPPRAHFHKGNSDPFSSLAIDLTPELYDAVRFRATEWFPAIFSPWGSPWAAMSSRIMEDEVVAALQEDTSAATSSLHYLTLYPGSSRDQSKAVKYQRMRLKVKAASLLRKKLQTKPLDPQVCMIVQLLFHAAVAAGDLQEALFHGTAIRDVLMKQQDWPGDLINSGTTWHDAHLSITFMQPTIFNIQASPNAMKDVFELVTQVQPSITRVDAALDRNLRDLTIQNRINCWLLYCPGLQAYDKYQIPPTTGFEVLNHAQYDLGRLINHHLEHKGLLGCVALTMILLLLSQAGDPMFGGKRVLPTTGILLRTMRDIWKSQMPLYGNAHLYCLFVGAQFEQRESKIANTLWFNQALARTASSMGLTQWPEVRDRIQGFLFLDYNEPQGQTWFGDILHEGISCNLHALPTIDVESWIPAPSDCNGEYARRSCA